MTEAMASQKPSPAPGAPRQISLVQSRETGDILPQTRQDAPRAGQAPNPFAKSWAHFVAGG